MGELVWHAVWALHLALPLHAVLWLGRRNERLNYERALRIVRDHKYYQKGRRSR